MYTVVSTDDHSRVVLSQLDHKSGRDYINASFIDVSILLDIDIHSYLSFFIHSGL